MMRFTIPFRLLLLGFHSVYISAPERKIYGIHDGKEDFHGTLTR